MTWRFAKRAIYSIPRMKIKLLDILIFFISLSCVVGFSLYAYGERGRPANVSVQAEGETYLYPLDRDTHLSFEGPLGETHVLIRNGTVSVESSPCQDKICVLSKPIADSGEWIACLPNRVFVKVLSEEESSVDAQSF